MAGGINSIILKLTSLCNLNCKYCYIYNHEDKSYRHRPKMISDEVFQSTLSRIREYCESHAPHRISITFHGGEPTLIPLARFDRLATLAEETLGFSLRQLSIQTNATLINDDWAAVLNKHNVSVGVSIDGPPTVHDNVRVDHAGKGSYDAVMAGIEKLRKGGIDPKVLCVINPGYSGLEVYRHFRHEGIRWMNFLMPDVSHDNKELFYGKYGATPVSDYLIPIFDEWFADDNPTVVIGIFWDLLQRLMGAKGISDSFGNPLMSYLIIETDGAIEPLDALRVCEDGITKSGLNTISNNFDDLKMGLPLIQKAVHEGFKLCNICEACEFGKVCGGGYLPHRYARANGFNNPSVWCTDILAILHHIVSVIAPFRGDDLHPDQLESVAHKPELLKTI